MPTIWTEDGYRFFFYSNESNEPPHVHVEKGGAYGKIWLGPPPVVDHANGFSPHELRRIRQIVDEHLSDFLEKWHDFFGP